MKDKIMNILLLAVVGAALALSFLRGAPETENLAVSLETLAPAAATPTPHPVDAYRARRTETRRQEQALLKSLSESEQTSPETRALAQAQLLSLSQNDEIELAVEAALAGLGYGRALCVAREGTVTVVTDQTLTEQDAALMLQLIAEVSGAAAENIRIAAC